MFRAVECGIQSVNYFSVMKIFTRKVNICTIYEILPMLKQTKTDKIVPNRLNAAKATKNRLQLTKIEIKYALHC
jgi:hypothetical protein